MKKVELPLITNLIDFTCSYVFQDISEKFTQVHNEMIKDVEVEAYICIGVFV